MIAQQPGTSDIIIHPKGCPKRQRGKVHCVPLIDHRRRQRRRRPFSLLRLLLSVSLISCMAQNVLSYNAHRLCACAFFRCASETFSPSP